MLSFPSSLWMGSTVSFRSSVPCLISQVSESGETDAQVEALLQARYDAKKAKDFTEADRIRDELKARGIEIIDTPQGAKWRKV